MKESDVIIFVDRNPDTTPGKVIKFVNGDVIKFPGSVDHTKRDLIITGLCRLAGSYQCQGRDEDHKKVIEILRKDFGLWCGDKDK